MKDTKSRCLERSVWIIKPRLVHLGNRAQFHQKKVPPMTDLGAATPILRIFDEAKAREFYIDFLGFNIDFEHRFGEKFPLYLGISLSGCALHLSEHHGDCSPGAKIRIPTHNVSKFCKMLSAKEHKFSKPSSGKWMPWGMKETTLTDPFGNKLVFFEDREVQTSA